MVEAAIYRPLEAVTEEPQPLTVEQAAKLFYHSFRHSQGSETLQGEIFRFLSFQNPQWNISDTEKMEIKDRVTTALISYTRGTNHQYLDLEVIKEKMNYPLEAMQAIFNSPSIARSANPVIHDLSTAMIRRDEKFLTLESGRPRTSSNPANPSEDPWLSFLCHYGLNGNTTNIPEFDEMYAGINDFIKDPPRAPKIGTNGVKRLSTIISVHNAHHPNEQVYLE